MDDNAAARSRRSTRDIKRPKFADEIVESLPSLNKALQKKRSERSFQSPEFTAEGSVAQDESTAPLSASAVTSGSLSNSSTASKPAAPSAPPAPASSSASAAPANKKKSGRPSIDRNSTSSAPGPEKLTVYRERVDSMLQTPKDPNAEEKPINMPDRKRKERIQAASKAGAFAQQQKAAMKSEDGLAGASTAHSQINETFRRWTVSDDIALIAATTHVCDLNTVYASTKFSKPFTLSEIDARWFAILYDEEMNRATMQRIEQLPSEQILKIQSGIPFSVEEEEILAQQSTDYKLQPGTFEDLLVKHRNVFHHARTPQILEQHWRGMRQAGLLADQAMQIYEEELLRMERDYDLNRLGNDDILLPTDVEDRNFMRELQNTHHEVEEWERVLTRAVTGINNVIQFDRGTLAVLKGRCVVFDIRKDSAIIGRHTQKHRVDVNLTFEGPTAAISRRQARLCIEPTGRSLLYNIGEASVYVDRRLVPKNSRAELHNNSLIEIGPIRLLFERNEELFRYRAAENAPEVKRVANESKPTATTSATPNTASGMQQVAPSKA